MPEKVIVLPMADETEPEFFGQRVDAFEVLVNYRDVAKVKVDASDKVLKQLQSDAELFTGPLPDTEAQKQTARFQRREALKAEHQAAPTAPPKPEPPPTKLDHGRVVLAGTEPTPALAADVDDPHGHAMRERLVASERAARAAEAANVARSGGSSAQPAPAEPAKKEEK